MTGLISSNHGDYGRLIRVIIGGSRGWGCSSIWSSPRTNGFGNYQTD